LVLRKLVRAHGDLHVHSCVKQQDSCVHWRRLYTHAGKQSQNFFASFPRSWRSVMMICFSSLGSLIHHFLEECLGRVHPKNKCLHRSYVRVAQVTLTDLTYQIRHASGSASSAAWLMLEHWRFVTSTAYLFSCLRTEIRARQAHHVVFKEHALRELLALEAGGLTHA